MDMDKKQTALWQRFTQTGQVSDYLRYHESTRREQENGRRRITDSSKYKEFIDIAEGSLRLFSVGFMEKGSQTMSVGENRGPS